MEHLYRDLFCRLYGCDSPVLRLGDIVHWSSVVRALGLASLPMHRQRVYLPRGYFYRPHTDPPAAGKVSASLAHAASSEAGVLYPVVRRDDDVEPLRAAGFTALPWFVEAEYRVRDGVDEDLRDQLGARRHRVLRRLARRAREQYALRVVGGRDLLRQPRLLHAFDRLHQLNLAKYGHSRNPFSSRALHTLLASEIGLRVCLAVRVPHGRSEPVQAILGVLAPGRRELSLLVQGIDHARVPRRHNLYSTALYELFGWGVERGVEVFNLGRGAERVKLDLGANAFHVLENHVALGPHAPAGLDTLRNAAVAHTAGVIRELTETARRREALDLIQVPAELAVSA